MSGSVNKIILVGNLGKNPDVRTMQSGGKVVSFSVATSESWKDKNGERQTRTQWHNCVIFNEGIAGVAEKYLKKGSKVYIEGQSETRKYEKDGRDVYMTEVVLRPYRGELTLPDSKNAGDDEHRSAKQDAYAPRSDARAPLPTDDIEDSIPF